MVLSSASSWLCSRSSMPSTPRAVSPAGRRGVPAPAAAAAGGAGRQRGRRSTRLTSLYSASCAGRGLSGLLAACATGCSRGGSTAAAPVIWCTRAPRRYLSACPLWAPHEALWLQMLRASEAAVAQAWRTCLGWACAHAAQRDTRSALPVGKTNRLCSLTGPCRRARLSRPQAAPLRRAACSPAAPGWTRCRRGPRPPTRPHCRRLQARRRCRLARRAQPQRPRASTAPVASPHTQRCAGSALCKAGRRRTGRSAKTRGEERAIGARQATKVGPCALCNAP